MHTALLAAPPPVTPHAAHRRPTPCTWDEWAAHLHVTWGLETSAVSTRVPLRLVATTGGLLLEFSGAGTRLTLRAYSADALRRVPLVPDCDCGHPHPDPYRSAPTERLWLDRSAPVRWERAVDGSARYGWVGIHAATLPVAQAAPILDELLTGEFVR